MTAKIDDLNVLDNWEDAGEADAQLDERQRKVQEIRQLEQKMQQQQIQQNSEQSSSSACQPPILRILRRPQSCEQLKEQFLDEKTGNNDNDKFCERGKSNKSFEERQAAYLEARERIFGEKYKITDDEDDENNGQIVNQSKLVENEVQNVATVLTKLEIPVVAESGMLLEPGAYGRPPAYLFSRVPSSPSSINSAQNSSG